MSTNENDEKLKVLEERVDYLARELELVEERLKEALNDVERDVSTLMRRVSECEQ